MSGNLDQFTKKELIGMLRHSFKPLDFYAHLELTAVMGGKPFALEAERHANHALKAIREIQKQAIEKKGNTK
jgi:hypothetical protein